jgi:hypothetical protein
MQTDESECDTISPPPPGTQADLSAAIECAEGGLRVTVANDGDAAGVVDVVSDDVVLEDDLLVPAGQQVDVLVPVDEGASYDVEVPGVDSFSGTRDCTEVEGVVESAPPAVPVVTPAPAPAAEVVATPAPAPETVRAATAARDLPRTGASPLPLVELGLALVLLGAAMARTGSRYLV